MGLISHFNNPISIIRVWRQKVTTTGVTVDHHCTVNYNMLASRKASQWHRLSATATAGTKGAVPRTESGMALVC